MLREERATGRGAVKARARPHCPPLPIWVDETKVFGLREEETRASK